MIRTLMVLILGWALPAQAMTIQFSYNQDEEESDERVSALNHRFLFAEGIIVPGDALTLKALLDEQHEDKQRTVILLTSKGGVLEEVDGLRNVILSAAKSYYNAYKEKLVVLVNLECSSACNILLAGLTQGAKASNLEIHVANSAKFGFHSPVGVQIVGSELKTIPIKSVRKFEEKYVKMVKAYQAYGVSHDWINTQANILRDPVMKFFTADKLCAEKSGIIPTDGCFDDANRDYLTEVSANIQLKRPVLQKTMSKEN